MIVRFRAIIRGAALDGQSHRELQGCPSNPNQCPLAYWCCYGCFGLQLEQCHNRRALESLPSKRGLSEIDLEEEICSEVEKQLANSNGIGCLKGGAMVAGTCAYA